MQQGVQPVVPMKNGKDKNEKSRSELSGFRGSP